MNLACRLCRVPINSLDGCEVCRAFKVNLVAIDEADEESPSLSAVGHEVIANLRFINKKANDRLRNPETFAKGADLALKAGNTMAKVLEAARKLQVDGVDAIKNMSFIERAELFITWYAALPPPYRAKVRLGQDKLEKQNSLPVPQAEEKNEPSI